MSERRLTELPGKGESSEPQDAGARQGSPQRLPHPHQQGPGAISLFSDRPTIIFGATVTHPHPRSSPSIAAVVASQDWPEIKKYVGLVCPQAHGQELIQDLHHSWQHPNGGTVSGGMIKELLISFCKSTGQKPQRIIFYRNGVSEGKFYQVLLFELDAIREACDSLEPNYHPQVTFVMVQKPQDTWLFANNHRDRNSDDRSGNILPGSAVDPKIWHPAKFNFFLCSSQGTSPSVQYHILWDENMFSVDELQSFSNNLRYTDGQRRTFAHVQPAVYAQMAASRASQAPVNREAETSGGGGGRRVERKMRAANAMEAGRVLKEVKKVTFQL